jgi:Zn-dependent oligopeptidase
LYPRIGVDGSNEVGQIDDPRIQEAATQAWALMFEYMNVLNTTTGLHEQLNNDDATQEIAQLVEVSC